MLHIWKIILYGIRELVFDSKDEYDFNSAKFNYRKFTVAIILGLSLAANVWLIREYLILVHVQGKCESHIEMMAAEEAKGNICPSPSKPSDPLPVTKGNTQAILREDKKAPK